MRQIRMRGHERLSSLLRRKTHALDHRTRTPGHTSQAECADTGRTIGETADLANGFAHGLIRTTLNA
jgi:hypothetical protein